MNAKVFIFNDDNATLTGGAVDNECFDMLLRAMQKHDEEKSKSTGSFRLPFLITAKCSPISA